MTFEQIILFSFFSASAPNFASRDEWINEAIIIFIYSVSNKDEKDEDYDAEIANFFHLFACDANFPINSQNLFPHIRLMT